jgi:site-specific DNA-methyltransferase (adenine-specific)
MSVKIYQQSSETMSQVPNRSIDLVITSPPYNAGKEYDSYNDDLPMPEYFAVLTNVFSECFRKLKKGGRIAVNVANLGRKPYIHLSGLIASLLKRIGFKLWGEIQWNKIKIPAQYPANGSTAWGSFQSPSCPVIRDSHEYIVLAVKESYKLQWRGETDLTKEEFKQYTLGEWFIPPARHPIHHCVFPEEIPERLIKLYSWVDAIVLDPFCGTGTTCFVAKKLNRHAIGYDISPCYVRIARERCSQNFLTSYMSLN